MLSLLEGNKRLAELKADIRTRETSILHALKNLEAVNLTTKSGGAYMLTPLGIMEAQICREYSSFAGVIEEFKDFWLSHDVTAIPPYLLLKIGALKDSTLVRTEGSELGLVHKTFLEILQASKRIRGISPIFHPDFVSLFKQLLSQGDSVELIVTGAVLKKTLASADFELMKKYVEEHRLKIFLRENLKVALTVTENIFSLGLFILDGEYDDKMDMVSFNHEAINWGEELFQDYLKGSGEIGVEVLKGC
jgi:predicted transcriptional regulator